jgi:hypothetical protein
MPQAAAVSTDPSFAGVLESLAAPVSALGSDRSDDGLEDDVAVLSQDGALRSQEYEARAGTGTEQQRGIVPESQRPAPKKPPQAERNPDWTNSGSRTKADMPVTPELNAAPAPPTDRRKLASVTLRMSSAECDRLRARAAESGLTVSAYLRSCAFEVESLRAQVKEALAQLRRASAVERQAPMTPRRSLLERVTHIWPRPRAEHVGSGA